MEEITENRLNTNPWTQVLKETKGLIKLIIINVSSQAEMNIQRLNVRIDQVHNKYQLNFLNPCRIDKVVDNFVAISSEFY